MPTIAQLEAYLAELYAARSAVLINKNYQVSGQAVTRADERWIAEQIAATERKIYKRNNNGEASHRVVFDRGGR